MTEPDYWGRCDTCGDPLTEVGRIAVYSTGAGTLRFRFCDGDCKDRFQNRDVHAEFDRGELVTDGGQTVSDEVRCGYCDSPHLAYRLKSDRGKVYRCIECLAIEQGQQRFSLPFDAWLDRDMVEPPDQDEFPDAPDFDAFDPREHDYNTARAWFSVLARIKDDDPIVKRDPDAIGTIFEDTREFLINVMGSDAHKRPSELREADAE